MKILILDDSANDRSALRDDILDADPDSVILEAANLEEWAEHLKSEPDLLFQDIRLDSNAEDEGTGLNALLEVIDIFPSLPVVVCTGYYFEHLDQFFRDFLGQTKQIIHYLDKSKINSGVLRHVFSKATQYRQGAGGTGNRGDKVAARIEELEKQTRDLQLSLEVKSGSLLYEKAFSGKNWQVRIDNEGKITGGTCTLNCLMLSKTLEGRIKELSIKLAPTNAQNITFFDRLKFIQTKNALSRIQFEHLMGSWLIRNEILHSGKEASMADGRLMHQSLQYLI